MKRFLSTLLIISCASAVCLAQSSGEAIKLDPGKAGANYYVYDYQHPAPMTPAPEGYIPVYISQFARHGARFCIGEYDSIHDMLAKASKTGMLSDMGKDFFKRYEPFYNKVKTEKGRLTEIGKAQHRAIADHLFARFPEVFDGPTRVEAFSTESPRVMMSMWTCMSELQTLDKDITIEADASASYAPWLQPSLKTNPYLINGRPHRSKEADKALQDYCDRTLPAREIAGRFFVDTDTAMEILKITPLKFVNNVYDIVAGTQCLTEDRGCFDDLLSPEEMYLVWKTVSAGFFAGGGNFEGSGSLVRDYAAFMLENFIECADADLASGEVQLRLRYGHDSGVYPFISLLDLNGSGESTSSLEESLDIFPGYEIPMGCSVQLVFFRNEEGKILVKALLNEREATLPLKAVSGPYYDWDDFKAHFLPVIAESKERIEAERKIYASGKAEPQPREEAIAALKAVKWNWKAVNGSSVEVANASVKIFGSTQSISVARFPIKKHSVSVVESDGPASGKTSKLAADNGALAAINGSYFTMHTKYPYPCTFVKDEGKIIPLGGDDKGSSRCNGMLRIKRKNGKEVDILSIDSLTRDKSAEGWYEAIESGPVLIEEGVTVDYEGKVGARDYHRFYGRRHPRTLVGYTKDGWMYFFAVDGRFPGFADGMSIAELQILCESFGLYEAINFDGGGSTTLWTNDGGVINHPYDNKRFDHKGERVVPNILIVR